jgi:hypothetical protein
MAAERLNGPGRKIRRRLSRHLTARQKEELETTT